MKRIVSAVLVTGCLSFGASGALAATPRAPVAPAASTAAVVCTMGSVSVSEATLMSKYRLPRRVADQIMNLMISVAARNPGIGMTCAVPTTTTPPPPPPVIVS